MSHPGFDQYSGLGKAADNSNDRDDVFALLMDMFGDVLPSELISEVCDAHKWNIELCIENLIQYNTNEVLNKATNNEISTPMPSVNAYAETERQQTTRREIYDNEDADVVIESEELQSVPVVEMAKKPAPSTGAIPKRSKLLNPFQVDVNNANAAETTYRFPNENEPVQMPTMSSFLKHGCNQFTDLSPAKVKQPKLSMIHGNKHPHHINKIIEQIGMGYKVMIIMRGAPGSGKSYLAREIIDMGLHGAEYTDFIFSTDDYFVNLYGQYEYNRLKLDDAHAFNQKRVLKKAQDGWSPVIVDNTNCKEWEMYPYFHMAVKFGYIVEIVESRTPWSQSAGKLAMRNAHNVPKVKIQQMLRNYRYTTVDAVFSSLNLRYLASVPQLRNFPPILLPLKVQLNTDDKCDNNVSNGLHLKTQNVEYRQSPDNGESVWANSWDFCDATPANQTTKDMNTPKPLRVRGTQLGHVNTDVSSSADPNTAQPLEEINDEWTAFEKERSEFWKSNATAPAKTISLPHNQLEPNIEPEEISNPNMFSILKAEYAKTMAEDNPTRNDPQEETKVLEKHCRNCKNENKSFAQIRQIYPSVPIATLWDLFLHCGGDGDWTMDILLKEEAKIQYNNIKNNVAVNNNFECGCDKLRSEYISKDQSAQSAYNHDTVNNNLHFSFASVPLTGQPTNSRSRRERISNQNEETKRQIEENFVIADEHYSEHTRKIRNIRRGVAPPVIDGMPADIIATEMDQLDDAPDAYILTSPPSAQEAVEAAESNEDAMSDTESDEMLEINLGIGLITQLDKVFGINAFNKDSLTNIKTAVFMPKSLAQQLYAIWMESLYNQIEEQRQISIKEDEEFARQLQIQQNHSLMQPTRGGANAKDILEMQLAWDAYKTQPGDDWQNPQTLASQMTHDKLYKAFPYIEQDTLADVLAAHDNNFAITVDVLSKTLPKCNLNESMEEKSQQLMEQANAEVQIISNCNQGESERPLSSTSTRSLETKKLAPGEAHIESLLAFQECRNKAQHHTQMKAECYQKAKDAIQKGDTSVAVYYSQIANLHKSRIDMYNHKAANSIMEAHNIKQTNPDMLDLHYLHVIEAIQCLDIFLDKQIEKLKAIGKVYKHIFVITGRGLHSVGGFSLIKIRTKNRLRERYLTWTEVNPGLLRVRLFTNSRLTMQLE